MSFDLKSVDFYYADKKIIDDFTLTLRPGRFYGIIGPNGSGKTTILDLLCKHRRPQSGEVLYQGINIGRYSKRQLSREIALVPQNFYINFPYTVEQVVMMGRYPHIPRFSAPSAADCRIVEDMMARTQISGFTDRLITELSGGERQRVIFARALVQDTPVLILDEATSNLDINYSLCLLNIAAQRVKQQANTVIAVMQDINLAATYCDYLIFMTGGKIAAHGLTAEVLNPDTIAAVFGVKSRVYPDSYCGALQVVFKK
jgi:ABC-type cobalamin/Fe3+-siderophores transport system ATPase subunit